MRSFLNLTTAKSNLVRIFTNSMSIAASVKLVFSSSKNKKKKGLLPDVSDVGIDGFSIFEVSAHKEDR